MSTSSQGKLLSWPNPAQAVTERLGQLAAFALHHKLPVALWRLPNAAAPQLCLGFSVEAALAGLPPALEPQAPAGFAFFPFRLSTPLSMWALLPPLPALNRRNNILVYNTLSPTQCEATRR